MQRKSEMVDIPTNRRGLELQQIASTSQEQPSDRQPTGNGSALSELLAGRMDADSTPFSGTMGPSYLEWLIANRPKKTPQSQVARQNSFSSGKFYRPFEKVCACDPALLIILSQLSTPDIIALMWTCRTVSHFVCSQTGAEVFREIIMVRDERWPMLAGIQRRKYHKDPPWTLTGDAIEPWKPISNFFKEVIQWVSHYRDMDSVEKRVQWAVDFKLQAERLQKSNLVDIDTMEKVMRIAQEDRLSEFMEIAKWNLSDTEAYLDIEYPQHLHAVEPQSSNPFAAPVYAFDASQLDEAAIPEPTMAFFPKFNDFSFNSYFSRLQFSHNITRIVLDGTSVTNLVLVPALRVVAKNLKFISTRNCRNITAKVYTEWLEEAVFEGDKLAIEEINTFGAAGLDGLFMADHTLINPLDFYRNGHAPPKIAKFGACMPFEDHAKYTLPLLIPQHFVMDEKLFIYDWMRYQLQKDTIEWEEFSKLNGLDPSAHYFSGGFILHEIPEQTRLLAICSYLQVDIDVNLCAGGRNCYTYRDREVPKMSSEGHCGPVINFPTGIRIPPNYYDLLKKWNSPHPFNLTQRYRRREGGGMPCRSCGHYECKKRRDFPGRLLPMGRWMELVHMFPNVHARLALSNFGGINYNQDEIGWNRICGTGEYCEHCIKNMSCSQCDAFFCMNCLIVQPQGLPNPWRLPVVPDTLLYHGICEFHKPICGVCIHVNDLVVQCKGTTCNKLICTLCHPNGVSLIPKNRKMDPTLPNHLKFASLHGMQIPVIGDVIGGITEMPERLKLREHLEAAGCEEMVLYDRCDVCRDTVCTDCEETIAESFTSCFGSCGRKICQVCTARVCDTCDRSLCEDCAVHDDEQRKQTMIYLFPEAGIFDPNDENQFQNCARCLLRRKIFDLEREGHELPDKQQHPELFPEDVYGEEYSMNGSETGDEEDLESNAQDNVQSWNVPKEEKLMMPGRLRNDSNLAYNAELVSFVAGHIPEEFKDLKYDPIKREATTLPSKTKLVKTALDKLYDQERIKLCRAIFICATLRPIMPFLMPGIMYTPQLSEPEVPFYKQKKDGIIFRPQHIVYSSYPKIIEDLQNKNLKAFLWGEYFLKLLQKEVDNFKKTQRNSIEILNVPVANPEVLSHGISMVHLLEFLYCRYSRFLLPGMREVDFRTLDNDRAQCLIRHQYIYHESLLHALKSESTSEYIDYESIIGKDLLHKYLDPEVGIWKVNQTLNYAYAKHIQEVYVWNKARNHRMENYIFLWKKKREQARAEGIRVQEFPDQQSDGEAELTERKKFEIMDIKNHPYPVMEPEDVEFTHLGSVYELESIEVENGVSLSIMFNDYT